MNFIVIKIEIETDHRDFFIMFVMHELFKQ